MTQKCTEIRGRPRGKNKKDVLFEHNGWTLWRFDGLNIALKHKDEKPHKTRYYASLGHALHGLQKCVGFHVTDLKEAADAYDDLAAVIRAFQMKG